MGSPKALLSTPPDGTPLLRHVISRLAPLGWGKTIVVTNDLELSRRVTLPAEVEVLTDAYPGMGALGGIATGLGRCSGWALVAATDMPLINPRLCAWLCCQVGADDGDRPFDVLIPHVDGALQPFHALYHTRVLPAILRQLARKERTAIGYLSDVRVRIVSEAEIRAVDPDLHSFVNANTPAEWDAALALLRAERDADAARP